MHASSLLAGEGARVGPIDASMQPRSIRSTAHVPASASVYVIERLICCTTVQHLFHGIRTFFLFFLKSSHVTASVTARLQLPMDRVKNSSANPILT
jgi:hypothetical protein